MGERTADGSEPDAGGMRGLVFLAAARTIRVAMKLEQVARRARVSTASRAEAPGLADIKLLRGR